jgi:hypothetical protein
MIFQRNPIITVNLLSAPMGEIPELKSRQAERQNQKVCEETCIDNDSRFLKRRVAEFGAGDIDGFCHPEWV